MVKLKCQNKKISKICIIKDKKWGDHDYNKSPCIYVYYYYYNVMYYIVIGNSYLYIII